MSEIEKLYENTGISKKRECEYADGICERTDFIPCDLCAIQKEMIYPPFTAEKQLSLMAFLINRKVGLSFKAEQGEITVEAISRGLAGIVNRIWQSLSPGEKQQVKGILE